MGQLYSLRRCFVLTFVGGAGAQASVGLLAYWLDGSQPVSRGGVLAVLSLVAIELCAALIVWRIARSRCDHLSRAHESTKAAMDQMRAAAVQREAHYSEAQDQARSFGAARAARRQNIAIHLDDVEKSSDALYATADELSRAILRITSETTSVAVAAEDANRKVIAVAASGQDFLEMISRIGEYAARSSRMGIDAVTQTEATSATIDELTSTTDQIGAMTALIAGIANQTNLLALNATIEAARAGEQGRGFAVVAAEVKSLASETARAVATIANMARTIRGSTERSVLAIRSIAASIDGLNQATADIADAVEERVQAAARMAESVGDVASNVGYVTSCIGKIEAVVDEAVEGVGFLRAAAGDIAEHTAAIRHDLEGRVRKIESPQLIHDTARHVAGAGSSQLYAVGG